MSADAILGLLYLVVNVINTTLISMTTKGVRK